MSVESWARRASGLLVPRMSLANPLGRFQVCPPGECCDPVYECQYCAGSGVNAPAFMQVDVAGVSDNGCGGIWCTMFNGGHICAASGNCSWHKFGFVGEFCPFYDPPAGNGSVAVRMLNLALRVGLGGLPNGATYEYTFVDPPNCFTFSSLVLPLLSTSGDGKCNWPASVTVTSL